MSSSIIIHIFNSFIRYFEKIADDCDIKHLNMLIESENIQSLNLVKKLGYQIISKWNYFSLPSKNNSRGKIKFVSIGINELNFKGMRFVDSWRWIPLTKDNGAFITINSSCLSCIQ